MEHFVTFILYCLERDTVEYLGCLLFVFRLCSSFFSWLNTQPWFLLVCFHKAGQILRDKLLYLEGQILLYEIICGAKHAEIVVSGVTDGFNLLKKIVSYRCVLLDVELVHLQKLDG